VPIYEYQCQACHERLERLQNLSDPPLTTCPECGGELKKQFSAPSFQFKGSGWYATDYARKGGGAKDGDKKSGESKSDSKEGSDASKSSAKSTAGGDKAAKSAAS
jgi:putative FmdB family regulatory protein